MDNLSRNYTRITLNPGAVALLGVLVFSLGFFLISPVAEWLLKAAGWAVMAAGVVVFALGVGYWLQQRSRRRRNRWTLRQSRRR